MPVWPLQSECLTFYGDPRQNGWYEKNVVPVPCPWTLHLGDVTTDHIHIHHKCADSLTRVLADIWIMLDRDAARIKALHYDIFDGSYCLRPMRGGKTLSIHSYAAAIDWDAEHNPWKSKKGLFTLESPLIVAFMKEGWTWGGSWITVTDKMHVQAARVHA